jgi:chaperone required for assembly of F1-ATPase
MRKGFHEPSEKPRRFYKTVEVAPADDGFTVLLDSRNLRTPGAARLIVPTRATAEQLAGEWREQGEVIEMAAMHANRLANTALDAVASAREATADAVAGYAASDLLCYFAEAPEGLVRRQAEAWDPVLQRAEADAGLSFVRAAGIVHRPQPQPTLDRVNAIALSLDDFGLAGLAFGASLFGSAILAIALLKGWVAGEEAYELSRIDESWQELQWGVDAEAAERTERLRGEAAMLEDWFRNLASA